MGSPTRKLIEAALTETKGRWKFRRSIFPNDPVNYAYVEWGEPDAGYGTGTLSEPMARYIEAVSPKNILALLDALEAAKGGRDDG